MVASLDSGTDGKLNLENEKRNTDSYCNNNHYYTYQFIGMGLMLRFIAHYIFNFIACALALLFIAPFKETDFESVFMLSFLMTLFQLILTNYLKNKFQ